MWLLCSTRLSVRLTSTSISFLSLSIISDFFIMLPKHSWISLIITEMCTQAQNRAVHVSIIYWYTFAEHNKSLKAARKLLRQGRVREESGFRYSDGEVGSPASEFCPQGSSKHFCSSFSSFFDRSLLHSSSVAHHSVCEQPESEFCLIFVSGTVMRQHPL